MREFSLSCAAERSDAATFRTVGQKARTLGIEFADAPSRIANALLRSASRSLNCFFASAIA